MIKHFEDLGFTVVASPDEYVVEYRIYEVAGHSHPDGLPVYERAKGVGPSGFTTSIDNADVYAHGHVKWDGCSNWYFDEQERGMLHECMRDGLLNIGKVLAACWDWTAVLCPRMADECLDEIEALASEATATRALVADMAVALRELLPSYCDPRSPVYPTHAAAEALIAKANAMVQASTRAE